MNEIERLADHDVRVNPKAYSDINRDYNRTYILLKNALTNYTFNIDKLIKRDVEKAGPSLLQKLFNNTSHMSATRVKLYPYKEILSMVFYHNINFWDRIQLSY